MPQTKSKNREDIIESYMSYAIENGVDFDLKEFCKNSKIKKKHFAEEFGSVKKIEKQVWTELMLASINTTTSDKQFSSFTTREKLLTLYYTFFENCSLNKAFLHQSIRHHGRPGMIKVLKPMKKQFIGFINAIQDLDLTIGKQFEASIEKITDKAVGEAFYGQLLFLLDFWMHDVSRDFEKTDVAIEKTVKATMDVLDVTPIKSVIDFGKFIWQERIRN